MRESDLRPTGFTVSVPLDQQRRYLRGGCFALAIMLRRKLIEKGFKPRIYGLFENDTFEGDTLHHAFVVVDGKAYDCRGELPLDAAAIGAGSAIGEGGEIRPITVSEINRRVVVDLHNIKREIGRYLSFTY
jgi:hypothetical protein